MTDQLEKKMTKKEAQDLLQRLREDCWVHLVRGAVWWERDCHIGTFYRVPTAQGKQGKWPTKFPVRENTGKLEILSKHGKHREFCLNTGNTEGLLLAEVVNVLILKLVKNIAMVAAKKSHFFTEAG